MKRKENQLFNIRVQKILDLEEGTSNTVIRSNWKSIAEELDKIGITIETDAYSKILEGQKDAIITIFTRLERYSQIIAGKTFLEFNNLEEEDVEQVASVYDF